MNAKSSCVPELRVDTYTTGHPWMQIQAVCLNYVWTLIQQVNHGGEVKLCAWTTCGHLYNRSTMEVKSSCVPELRVDTYTTGHPWRWSQAVCLNYLWTLIQQGHPKFCPKKKERKKKKKVKYIGLCIAHFIQKLFRFHVLLFFCLQQHIFLFCFVLFLKIFVSKEGRVTCQNDQNGSSDGWKQLSVSTIAEIQLLLPVQIVNKMPPLLPLLLEQNGHRYTICIIFFH